jgi:hypothetical protein
MKCALIGYRRVLQIRLDRSIEFDRHRIAMTVQTLSRGNADPAFAHAVLFDIGLFVAVEPDAHAARKKCLVVVGAARVNRKSVRQCFAHVMDRLSGWEPGTHPVKSQEMQAFSDWEFHRSVFSIRVLDNTLQDS